MQYKMKIGIRYPIPNQEIDFTERENKEAISEAVEVFNGSNNKKHIKEYKVSRNYIDILLQCNEVIARPLKELSSFSRNLYPILGRYSSVEGKLFKAISLSEIDEDMYNLNNRKLSDDELVEALRYLLKFKSIGSESSKEKKYKSIQQIEEIITDIL